MFCVIPCTDDYIPVDLRTRPFDVTPQEVSGLAVCEDFGAVATCGDVMVLVGM